MVDYEDGGVQIARFCTDFLRFFEKCVGSTQSFMTWTFSNLELFRKLFKSSSSSSSSSSSRSVCRSFYSTNANKKKHLHVAMLLPTSRRLTSFTTLLGLAPIPPSIL